MHAGVVALHARAVPAGSPGSPLGRGKQAAFFREPHVLKTTSSYKLQVTRCCTLCRGVALASCTVLGLYWAILGYAEQAMLLCSMRLRMFKQVYAVLAWLPEAMLQT